MQQHECEANGCELAYSKVQVECDICRACSIQDGVEAWSPEKKHWCCTKQGKGCEGDPSSVSKSEQFVYVGESQGSWTQNSNMQYLGAGQEGRGRGAYERDIVKTYTGYRCEDTKINVVILWYCDQMQQHACEANGCELAYSKVQVECDICRACSIQDRGGVWIVHIS
eukprot:s10189_g1.t1